jgi:hypothetical protein
MIVALRSHKIAGFSQKCRTKPHDFRRNVAHRSQDLRTKSQNGRRELAQIRTTVAEIRRIFAGMSHKLARHSHKYSYFIMLGHNGARRLITGRSKKNTGQFRDPGELLVKIVTQH